MLAKVRDHFACGGTAERETRTGTAFARKAAAGVFVHVHVAIVTKARPCHRSSLLSHGREARRSMPNAATPKRYPTRPCARSNRAIVSPSGRPVPSGSIVA